MAYKRRITEDGGIRITEVGDTRILESSEGGGVPDPSGASSVPLDARVLIIPANSFNGKVYITTSADEGGEYLGGNLIIPTYVNTPTPQFTWYNSTEPDLDTVSYEIQLAQDFDWDGASSFTESAIPEDVGLTTSHRIVTSLTPDVIYNWRVRAWDGYEYSAWSNPSALIYIQTLVTIRDLYASVNVIRSGEEDLGASVTVTIDDTKDLGAKIFVTATEDLGGKITISSISDLGGLINIQNNAKDLDAKITIIPSSDLGASVFVHPKSDLDGKVTVVEYRYTNLLARVFIAGTKDLLGSIDVIPYKELGARIRIITMLKASVEIPPKKYLDLEGSANVTVDHQMLWAKVNVGSKGDSDLGGTVRLGTVTEDLGGRVTITWDYQRLDGKVNVTSKDTDDLGGTVNIDVDYQLLDAKVNILVPGDEDLGGTIDVDYNPPPSGVNPIAYVVPSGYPPLPAEWLNGDIAVPPSGAVVVPSGVPQGEESVLFVWEPLVDWGYGADEDGYFVAWNDNPNHSVTLSDQFVPNNYIDKTWEDGGSLYFHVRPKNTHGWLGPQSTYNVIINHKPSVIGEPLQVDGLDSPTLGNLAPEFSWEKAVDQDQLDIVTYSLQIATDSSFNNTIRDYSQFSVIGSGTTAYFQLPTVDKLPGTGQFFWRVRAYDGWEYGEWSTVHNFSIERTNVALGARFTIPTYNFAQVKAQVTILPYKELWGRVEVVSTQLKDLKGRVNVSYKDTLDLSGTIRITSTRDLGAKCFVINYKDLGGRVNVFGVYGAQDLRGKITLSDYDKKDLWARVNVATPDESDLGATVLVVPRKELGASVYLYNSTHIGHLFGENFPATVSIIQSGISNLGGRFTSIADRPGPVVITSNLPEAEWQTSKDAIFDWTASSPGLTPVVSYHTQLDQNATTEADDEFQTTALFSRSFDLEIQGGAGVYYFHVAARNSAGNFGPTVHYEVRYNRIPSNPTSPMTVNSLDAIGGIPMVGSTVDLFFEWGQSYDDDDLDAISYRMQIATREDFGLDINDSSSIVYDESGIPTFFDTILGGSFIPSGEYHWRIKAFDGHQWSDDWGPTAHFTVNTPPLAPSNLLVYKA